MCEIARDRGMATGNVSTSEITDATPAGPDQHPRGRGPRGPDRHPERRRRCGAGNPGPDHRRTGDVRPFRPGVAQEYTASIVANVVSSAADATLTVADPSSIATGHLINGSFSLPAALQAKARSGGYAPVGGSVAPTTLLSWAGPVSNDAVTVDFKQPIAAGDALRTGIYSKTLTLTLSTTAP
jgi:hypothetical protein